MSDQNNNEIEQSDNKKETPLKENESSNNSPRSPKEANNNKKTKKLNKVKTSKTISRNQNIKINYAINLKNNENISDCISEINNKLTTNDNKNTQNLLTYKSTTQIINELPKNEVFEIKMALRSYKINFIFRNEDFSINLKENNKIINLRQKISKLLNIDADQLSIYYKDNEIQDSSDDILIKDFFNFPKNKSRPLLLVKKKQNNVNTLSNSQNNYDKFCIKYTLSYDNKVKISNYPSVIDSSIDMKEDIYNILNTFFKENSLKIDFHCENFIDKNGNVNNYIIGFTAPDIAFDFNRYMNSLRLLNPAFKDIKIQILLSNKKNKNKKREDLDKKDNTKKYDYNYNYRYGVFLNFEDDNVDRRNQEVINLLKERFINNKKSHKNSVPNFISISNPYISPYEEYKKAKNENKKKWLSPEGFITSVDKYSGIQI